MKRKNLKTTLADRPIKQHDARYHNFDANLRLQIQKLKRTPQKRYLFFLHRHSNVHHNTEITSQIDTTDIQNKIAKPHQKGSIEDSNIEDSNFRYPFPRAPKNRGGPVALFHFEWNLPYYQIALFGGAGVVNFASRNSNWGSSIFC